MSKSIDSRPGRDHAALDPKIVVALIHDHPVALQLPRDVLERLVRETLRLAENELLIQFQRPVDPVPIATIAREVNLSG